MKMATLVCLFVCLFVFVFCCCFDCEVNGSVFQSDGHLSKTEDGEAVSPSVYLSVSLSLCVCVCLSLSLTLSNRYILCTVTGSVSIETSPSVPPSCSSSSFRVQ